MSERERIRELEEALRQRDRQLAERDAIIQDLLRQVQDLKDQLDAWKRGHRIRSGGKLAQKKKPRRRKPTGQLPGRPTGHKGQSRCAPPEADEHHDVFPPNTCPFCGGEVALSEEPPGTQLVEDLIPAKKVVRAYHRHKGHCQRCGKQAPTVLPDGLGENPKLGINAQAEILKARTQRRLTLGQIQCQLKDAKLHVSRGGIQQVLSRAAQVMKPALQEIRREIVQSRVAWADETPLKVCGESGYLWLLMTREVVLFEWHDSRGKEVARSLLEGFEGFLHSDFYAVYFGHEKIQNVPCRGHLNREARQLAERDGGRLTREFSERLKEQYCRAVEAQEKEETALLEQEKLREELEKLARDSALGRHPEIARLQKRLLKHLDGLVRFVENPELEGTNNRAERQLIGVAVMRQVSGGARSLEGAEAFATLLSVSRTAAVQGVELEEFYRKARIAFHEKSPFPSLLSSPDPPRLPPPH